MQLVLTKDFESVKNKYIDVINNTPELEKHARWVYGQHPTDEMIKSYIENGEMYLFYDCETVAGMVALVMGQGKDYEAVSWVLPVSGNEVLTLHMLAVCPEYQGRAIGGKIIEAAAGLARSCGKKVLRLDALASNLPAQKMYEKAGFLYRGKQFLYAENTGWTDFLFYEKVL